MPRLINFCGFDEGLIGTKAIGSVAPNSLNTHKYEEHVCELNVYAAPSDAAEASVISCRNFQNIPNRNAHFDNENYDPIQNGYFQLLAFDATDDWVQIASISGDKKWVQQISASPTEYPYQHISNDAPAYVNRNIPTQTGIYDEPRLDKPAQYKGQQFGYLTDSWIDYTIPLDFFSHEIFKVLKTYDLFDPNHIEGGKLATHYGDFLYVGYDVKAIIKDKDGREWLKAAEYLTVSPHDYWGLIDNQIESQGITLSEEERLRIRDAGEGPKIRSKAGQTVYFPYREPSGTIIMVMTSGPDCD